MYDSMVVKIKSGFTITMYIFDRVWCSPTVNMVYIIHLWGQEIAMNFLCYYFKKVKTPHALTGAGGSSDMLTVFDKDLLNKTLSNQTNSNL